MIELKPIDKGRKPPNIKAFALEKGDSSVPSFRKSDFVSALKKASRRISTPDKEPSQT